MPSPNTIKTYSKNTYFHAYNLGVERRRIFEDAQDYQKFMYYLKIYLTPGDVLHQEDPLLRLNLVKNNLAEEVSLLCFCLMPNHFHMLLHQKTKDGITKLMRQLTTAYSMYFNKRYDRIGPLFQGTFKAVPVSTEEQLLELSHFIHLNPVERGASLKEFQWSSYLDYLKKRQTNWVKTSLILDFAIGQNPNFSYENFVEKSGGGMQKIANLTLDE